MSCTTMMAPSSDLSSLSLSKAQVEGFETLDYLHNLQDREQFTEQGYSITSESQVDKIYLSTHTKIVNEEVHSLSMTEMQGTSFTRKVPHMQMFHLEAMKIYPLKEVKPPQIPEDVNTAIKSGKVRAPTHYFYNF